jgi:hypothetical protein
MLPGAGTHADRNPAGISSYDLPVVFPVLERVLLYLGAMPQPAARGATLDRTHPPYPGHRRCSDPGMGAGPGPGKSPADHPG